MINFQNFPYAIFFHPNRTICQLEQAENWFVARLNIGEVPFGG